YYRSYCALPPCLASRASTNHTRHSFDFQTAERLLCDVFMCKNSIRHCVPSKQGHFLKLWQRVKSTKLCPLYFKRQDRLLKLIQLRDRGTTSTELAQEWQQAGVSASAHTVR
uniref:Transposase Tc1-like domain-containing protein n=1 Tax=Salmo trutta TaxID=8032 RepID=A0A674AG73_SALTR